MAINAGTNSSSASKIPNNIPRIATEATDCHTYQLAVSLAEGYPGFCSDTFGSGRSGLLGIDIISLNAAVKKYC